MNNKEFDIRIKRVRIYGLLGIIYSAYLVYEYFYKDKIKWMLVISISLFIISLLFILSSLWLKRKKK